MADFMLPRCIISNEEISNDVDAYREVLNELAFKVRISICILFVIFVIYKICMFREVLFNENGIRASRKHSDRLKLELFHVCCSITWTYI